MQAHTGDYRQRIIGMGAVDRLSLTRTVLPQPSEEIASFGKFRHSPEFI